MFPDDANFLSPLHPIYRRASVSREDLSLDHYDGCIVRTTSFATEICAASMLNDNMKELQDVIASEVQMLLQYHEGNEDNSGFACQQLLRATCDEVLATRFCEHCKEKRTKGLKTSAFADEQRNHFDVELNDFRHKWKGKFTNE